MRKTSRSQQEEIARQENWKQFVTRYNTRFAQVLYAFFELATGYNKPADVQLAYNESSDMYHFILEDLNAHVYCDTWLPVELLATATDTSYQSSMVSSLQQVELALSGWAEYIDAQKNKARKKQLALAKLTDEDKDILGLSS